MLFTLSTPPALKSLRALSRPMSGTSFSVSSSLVLTLRPPDGRSWPSDWYLVEKPRARFQREINAREPREKRKKSRGKTNNGFVNIHIIPPGTRALVFHSAPARITYLNIIWIFDEYFSRKQSSFPSKQRFVHENSGSLPMTPRVILSGEKRG